jgi:large subunit ribosomal protein L5
MPALKERYQEQVRPQLVKQFGLRNIMEVPRVNKVTVNIGMGEAIQNPKSMDAAIADLRAITGQQPVIIKARRSVAAFKLRTGMPIGLKVTLRGPRMWDFLDKLMNIALPRIRDFRGSSPSAFDGHGNYTLGIKEQMIFPEIDYDKIDRQRGLEVTVCTTARDDEQGRALLAGLGMPFRR